MTRTLCLSFLVAALLASAAARAEKGDREKEINVGADLLTADDRSRTSTFEGNVVVTQGTMRITAAKVTVKEDPERYKFYVATGAPVTFRQKRDKGDDWIEGSAERAEFDDRSSKLKLYERARLKSSQGEIAGDVITYDTNRELFEVSGGAQSAPGGSRVKATLVPPKKGAAKGESAAPPVKLKTDTTPAGTN